MNLELLREVCALVDGLPERCFDLNCFVQTDAKKGKHIASDLFENLESTVCVIGMIAAHPKMSREFDIKHVISSGEHSDFRTRSTKSWIVNPIAHVAAVLDIFSWEAKDLFDFVGKSQYDSRYYDLCSKDSLTHKNIFANRVVYFLEDRGHKVSKEWHRKAQGY